MLPWCLLGTVFLKSSEPTTVEIAPGVHMPRVSLGTCCGSDPGVGVPFWFASGGIGIDTAWDYNNSHALSRAIESSGVRREQVFITTKVPAGVGADLADKAGAGNSSDCSTDPHVALNYVIDSVQQLHVNFVDLVLLHGPCSFAHPPVPNASASNNALWKGLEMAKSMGLTRAIGVSNFNKTELENLKAASDTAPAVNQCQMSINTSHIYLPAPFPAPHDEATIAYCKANNITYQAYRTVGGCPMHEPRVVSIGQKYNKTAAQVCLRWVLERGAILTTGTGSDPKTVGQYSTDDLNLFDWRLQPSEVEELNKINGTQPL